MGAFEGNEINKTPYYGARSNLYTIQGEQVLIAERSIAAGAVMPLQPHRLTMFYLLSSEAYLLTGREWR